VTAATGNRGAIGAAIILITLVGVSLSLFIPLLSIRMEQMGISGTVSGLNSAVAGIGTLCVAPFVPKLAARFGLPRIIMVSLMTSAATAIGFFLLPFVAWFPLRFMFGVSIGTLFVLSEYWITAAATPARRGLIMGIYATMLSVGFVCGPIILKLTGTTGFPPYAAGALLYIVAMLPLAFSWRFAPTVTGESHHPVSRYLIAVPTATFAGLVFGAVETGGFALFPVYGLRNVMPETTAALLISVVAAGNIISQVPIGLLSDHMDRRHVLLMCALVGVAGCLAMPFALADMTIFFCVLFIWGGFTGGLYTVGLAHLGARITGPEMASANAAFVMLYSVGLVVGPPLAGVGMDVFGNDGLTWSLAAMLAAYALLVVFRLMRLRV
jgi:MFS family permease